MATWFHCQRGVRRCRVFFAKDFAHENHNCVASKLMFRMPAKVRIHPASNTRAWPGAHATCTRSAPAQAAAGRRCEPTSSSVAPFSAVRGTCGPESAACQHARHACQRRTNVLGWQMRLPTPPLHSKYPRMKEYSLARSAHHGGRKGGDLAHKWHQHREVKRRQRHLVHVVVE